MNQPSLIHKKATVKAVAFLMKIRQKMGDFPCVVEVDVLKYMFNV